LKLVLLSARASVYKSICGVWSHFSQGKEEHLPFQSFSREAAPLKLDKEKYKNAFSIQRPKDFFFNPADESFWQAR